MSEKKLKMNYSSKDLLLGKLTKTLQVISGFMMEAKGDISMDTNYPPQAVYNRIESIQAALYSDIEKIAEEIDEEQ